VFFNACGVAVVNLEIVGLAPGIKKPVEDEI
jgi:hypothetical protein